MTEDEKLSTETSINNIKSEWYNFNARDYNAREIDVYDIDNAWFHALNELKLPKIAKEINSLTKHERVPKIKEYEKKYPKLLKKIEEIWLKWIKEFIILNKIDIKNIISVRFNFISLKGKTLVTILDINKNVHFTLLDKRGMKPKDKLKNKLSTESFINMGSLLKGFTSTHETDTEAKKKTKIFKCPVCKKKYNSAKFLENHVTQEHNDMIPREMPVAQFIFNLKNKKEHGNCVICKRPTLWNEKINKYHRFCSNKCKEVYIKEARARLMRVYGTDNLAKDPEHQKKMLENRKISKKYTFSDGGVINCVGSYEYDFIKYCDEVLGLGSKDIIDPSHSDILFRYEFENKERFYIPDYYLPDYNLLVELKDAGDNNHPNIKMHMKAMDNEKFRAVIESNKYNFITICGKDYSKFVELIEYLKSKPLNEKSDDKLIISIDQNVYKQYGLTSNF